MSRIAPLLRRFAQDESGVFAVLFGLMAIVLIALGGATVDYVSLEQTRQRAQLALDAAVLALQSEINDEGITEESIRTRAEAIVTERIGNELVTMSVDAIAINRETGRLFLGGNFTIPTMFVSLVGVNELGASFSAEAMQGSVNLEIALGLDVTGSMGGSRISDLKAAAKEFVDEILAVNGGEALARVALVPYSQAVNAAGYASALRGAVRPPMPISNITWASGSSKGISGATNTTPVRITSSGHGFQNGDWVYIQGVYGPSYVNGNAYQVQNRTGSTFELAGTWSNWWYDNGSGGTATKCQKSDCGVVVTSNNHGFSVGDYPLVSEVGGMTALNNRALYVSEVTTNTLVLNGVPAGQAGNYVAGTGKLDCTSYLTNEACPYLVYPSASGSLRIKSLTTCVTERAANPTNDQPPSVNLVGRNYPTNSNECPNSPIVPLTTDRDSLVAAIDALPATGTTSGSLGILWSWYMLSPNFGYVWPQDSRPELYGTRDLLKAAIIMTDGEFNTVHYHGVQSRESTIAGNERHANYAHNGSPYAQARAYCDAMRAAQITVYTVGFEIGAGTAASDVMTYCASEPGNYFPAEDGEKLKDAFRQIARSISSLRLTQ